MTFGTAADHADNWEGAREAAAAGGLELGGDAIIDRGQLRLTRAGDPSLSPTAVGWENQLRVPDGGYKPYDATPSELRGGYQTLDRYQSEPLGDTVHRSGSAVLTMPPGTHPFHIFVSFQLIIAGGTGGDGMSLSYGGSLTTREPFTKRRGHIGEEGAGLGVRVLFRTARGGPSIEVWHDGAAIAVKPCPDLRSGELTKVTLTIVGGREGSQHLTLTYGDETYWDKIPLPGYAPQPGWQLAFGAAAGALTDNHWVDELLVRTGALVDATPVPVYLSLNGQQFETGRHAPLRYTYLTQDAAEECEAMEMGCEYGTEWDHERSIVRSFDYLELWPDDDAVRVDKGLVLQGEHRRLGLAEAGEVINSDALQQLGFGMDFKEKETRGGQGDQQPPPISVDRMGGDLPPAYGNLGADDTIDGAVGEIGFGKTHGFTDPDVAAPEYGIA